MGCLEVNPNKQIYTVVFFPLIGKDGRIIFTVS